MRGKYLKAFDLTIQASCSPPRAWPGSPRSSKTSPPSSDHLPGEVRWAHQQHLQGGLSLDDVVDAVQQGLEGEDAADSAGHSIRVGQILSAMRQNDRAVEIAELALDHREDGVVGFDIAGPEDGFRPLTIARRSTCSPRTSCPSPCTPVRLPVWHPSAARCSTDGRCGSGTACIVSDLEVMGRDGDEVQVKFGDLARWVRDREIPLELSPSSNVHTAAIEAWGTELADHPFDLLYQLGFAVTVNVDNRTMSGTSLTRELALLVDAFGYDLDDLETFQFNAAAAAFLPVEEAPKSSSS